jgi:predicted Zn-dependent protease
VTALRLRAALGAGDSAAAERLAAAVTAADPDDGVSQMARLALAHRKGDLPAALAALEALATDRASLPEARLLTAELLAAAGRTDEATALRQRVAQGYERDPRSVVWRQKAARALGS